MAIHHMLALDSLSYKLVAKEFWSHGHSDNYIELGQNLQLTRNFEQAGNSMCRGERLTSHAVDIVIIVGTL